MLTKKSLVILLMLLGTVGPVTGAVYDPSVRWMERDTDHFIIIYDAMQTELADTAAGIAERMYDSVTVLLQHEPVLKTAIILADNIDMVNAYTAMQWYPHIYIAPVTAPPLDIAGGSARWLELVISHELTHAVQQDMAGGLPGIFRAVFGRLLMNNAWQPFWAIEGPAVYAESRFTGAGRGQGGIYSMVLRTMVRDSCMLRMDQAANYNLIKWPAGASSYLYGNALMNRLTAEHGDNAIARFNHDFKEWPLLWTGCGCSPVPFFSWSFKRTTGTWASQFFREWRDSTASSEKRVINRIRNAGETPYRALTARGYHAASPSWFPGKDVIAYTCATDELHPQLRVLNLETGKDARVRTFINGATRSSVSVSPDGTRLAYAELMPRSLHALHNDLFVYDFRNHATVRITRGARGSDPTWSPDGNTLAYVTASPFGNNLMTVGADGTGTTALTGMRGWTFSRPAWSPEGNRIVMAYSRNGTTGLCLYDFSAPDSLTLLTAGPHIDADPCWSPDGKYIIFSSNRTGVFNLYALHPHAGSLNRITNLTGGAFSPAMSPDGRRIAYRGYSSEGYDIHIMNTADGCAVPVTAFTPGKAGIACMAALPPVAAASAAGRPYRPWRTFLPRMWLPMAAYDGHASYYGATTVCADVLGRHALTAGLVYASEPGQVDYEADYTYSRFTPGLSLRVSRVTSDNAPDTQTVFRADRTAVSLALPGIGSTLGAIYRTRLTLGFSRTVYRDLDTAAYTPAGAPTTYHTPRLQYSMWSYDYLSASISPENGFSFTGYGRGTDISFGSSYRYLYAYWALRLYLPSLLPHHVISPYAYWATYRGEEYWGSDGTGDVLYGSCQYRMPLWYPQAGFRTLPFFISKTSLYLHAGTAFGPGPADDAVWTYGADLNIDLILMHMLSTTFVLSAEWNGNSGPYWNFSLGLPLFNKYYTGNHETGSDTWDLSKELPKTLKRR